MSPAVSIRPTFPEAGVGAAGARKDAGEAVERDANGFGSMLKGMAPSRSGTAEAAPPEARREDPAAHGDDGAAAADTASPDANLAGSAHGGADQGAATATSFSVPSGADPYPDPRAASPAALDRPAQFAAAVVSQLLARGPQPFVNGSARPAGRTLAVENLPSKLAAMQRKLDQQLGAVATPAVAAASTAEVAQPVAVGSADGKSAGRTTGVARHDGRDVQEGSAIAANAPRRGPDPAVAVPDRPNAEAAGKAADGKPALRDPRTRSDGAGHRAAESAAVTDVAAVPVTAVRLAAVPLDTAPPVPSSASAVPVPVGATPPGLSAAPPPPAAGVATATLPGIETAPEGVSAVSRRRASSAGPTQLSAPFDRTSDAPATQDSGPDGVAMPTGQAAGGARLESAAMAVGSDAKAGLQESAPLRAKVTDQATHMPVVTGPPVQQIVDAIVDQAANVGAETGGVAAPLPIMGPPAGQTMVRTLSLTLEPGELGTVSVHMRLTAGKLDLSIEAEQPQTLQSLERDQAVLSSALSAAGVSVDALTIKAAVSGQAGTGGHHGASQLFNASSQSDSRSGSDGGGSSGASQGDDRGNPRRGSGDDARFQRSPGRAGSRETGRVAGFGSDRFI